MILKLKINSRDRCHCERRFSFLAKQSLIRDCSDRKRPRNDRLLLKDELLQRIGIHAFCCLTFFVFLCLPFFAHAAKGDYEQLVQRNLEMRQQLQVLEEKYSNLENERNVLIGHIRSLQQEKEKLRAPGQVVLKEDNRYAQMEAAFEEVSGKITVVTEEKDRLKQELSEIKSSQEKNGAMIKDLESRRDALAAQVKQAGDAFSRQQLFEQQNSSQAVDMELKQLKDKNARMQKNFAMDLAFYKAQQEGMATEHRSLLEKIDRLKLEVDNLTKNNTFLVKDKKDIEASVGDLQKKLAAFQIDSKKKDKEFLVQERKWESKFLQLARSQQTAERKLRDMGKLKKKLDGQQALEQKQEALVKKLNDEKIGLETKLENKFKDFEKLKEEISVQQVIQKEQEALIKELVNEKSNLEIKLAKQKEIGAADASAVFLRQKRILPESAKQRLDMHFNLAVAYDKTHMYKAEEKEYLECLRIDSNDGSVHYNLGILYDDKLNDNIKAVQHYKKYLELNTAGEETTLVKHWIMIAEQQDRLHTQTH